MIDHPAPEACPALVLETARAIGCDPAVLARLEELQSRLDWTTLLNIATQLTSAETAGAAHQRLAELLPQDTDNGMGILTGQLLAAALVCSIYPALGLDDGIWTATMAAFSRFLRETHRNYGSWTYDRGFWSWRQTALLIIRLGTLEFEYQLQRPDPSDPGKDWPDSRYLPLPDAAWCRPGSAAALAPDSPGYACLSVHIPSDARLTRAELDASYARAIAVFDRLHAEHPERYPLPVSFIACYTWLLAPGLYSLLPADSGIRRFADDYILTRSTPESTSHQLWLFGVGAKTLEELPGNTSLQRAARRHLLSGGQLGDAGGPLRASTVVRAQTDFVV
ncbi:MAG: acyltransferase domain-containing protein [Bacillota bacterium]|nr:acyltransferase domain-containing protein [Bacillota bacterium]